MRIVSSVLQERQRKHYGRLHIDTRVAQVHDVATRVQAAIALLSQRESALAARLAQRLWWPPSWVQQLLAGPQATLAALRVLHTRLEMCAQGFAALPLNTADTAPAPAAVAL
jgi:MoxR-like ATPase